MTTRIGINGFGRIGRLTLRAMMAYHQNDLEVVAVNDLADTKTNAHLFKWDSVFGPYSGEVSARRSAQRAEPSLSTISGRSAATSVSSHGSTRRSYNNGG